MAEMVNCYPVGIQTFENGGLSNKALGATQKALVFSD